MCFILAAANYHYFVIPFMTLCSILICFDLFCSVMFGSVGQMMVISRLHVVSEALVHRSAVEGNRVRQRQRRPVRTSLRRRPSHLLLQSYLPLRSSRRVSRRHGMRLVQRRRWRRPEEMTRSSQMTVAAVRDRSRWIAPEIATAAAADPDRGRWTALDPDNNGPTSVVYGKLPTTSHRLRACQTQCSPQELSFWYERPLYVILGGLCGAKHAKYVLKSGNF